MKYLSCGFVILLLLLYSPQLFSQEIDQPKFGKLSKEEFQIKSYPVEPEAAAVVVFDKGHASIEGNYKGGFAVLFKHYKKVHILNKNGYDAGDISIPLYSSGRSEEIVRGLKAVSYNLENGKVVETKLDKKNIFTEKINDKWSLVKFTLPNLKEGTIFEIEYSIKSDFIFNFQPWEFQGNYPRLWSEFNAAIPQFLGYIFLSQGYHPFHINTNKNYRSNIALSTSGLATRTESATISTAVTEYRWVQKDVPSLKEENYTTTLKNHISKIEFQLNEYKEPLTYKKIMGSWASLSEEMMKDDRFGYPLTQPNGFLSEIISEVTQSDKTNLENAISLYYYINNNYTSTTSAGMYFSKTLRNIIRDKNGTTADINLLLTALYKKAGYEADPVILSTRQHGYTYEYYPLIDRFNYTITRVKIDDKYYFLDATRNLNFGRLSYQLYNGHGRVMNKQAEAVHLNSKDLNEVSITTVIISNSDDGINGAYRKQPGYFESIRIKNAVKTNGQEKYFESIQNKLPEAMQIKESYIDSLDKREDPLVVKFNFQLNGGSSDLLYFNPLIMDEFKENPFKAADRKYPVEMPYSENAHFILSFEVPNGYEVDEIPKTLVLKLNENNDIVYEYRISQSGGIISLRSKLSINRTVFLPEEYELLREFFNIVVNKQNENIVLKKSTP